MRYATRSALVVLCPEADEALGRWRERYDPAVQLGIPAHITLLYPFVAPVDIDAAVLDTVSRTVARFSEFDFELVEVSSFGPRVLWVAPEPRELFVELTASLAGSFPDYPRYGGEFGDVVVPHLTVAEGVAAPAMRTAAHGVSEVLPVQSRCSEVALLAGGDRRWSWNVLERFPLSSHPLPAQPGSGSVLAGSTGQLLGGPPASSTVVVGDEEWARHRNAVTQRLFGVDAETFAATFATGDYDPCDVEEALCFFPELS